MSDTSSNDETRPAASAESRRGQIEGLHHIVLFCRHINRTLAFYRKVGFEVLRSYEDMHWLRFGDAEIMLHPSEDTVAGKAPAIHAAVSDVDALLEHVIEQGLEPYDHQHPGRTLTEPIERQWGDREFELDDPEGHRWAFTQSR